MLPYAIIILLSLIFVLELKVYHIIVISTVPVNILSVEIIDISLNLPYSIYTYFQLKHWVVSHLQPNKIKCANTATPDSQKGKYSSSNSAKKISQVAQKDDQLIQLKEKVTIKLTIGEICLVNSSPIITLHNTDPQSPNSHGPIKLTIPSAIQDQGCDLMLNEEQTNHISTSSDIPLAESESGFEEMYFKQPNVLQIWLSSKDHSAQEVSLTSCKHTVHIH